MNTKLLIDVAGSMRALADSIQAFCEASTSEEQPETPVADAPAVEPKKTEETIPLEKVRGVLAEKSNAGHTEEVRAIINKYGAECLSGVDPKDYASVLTEGL